ncbi:MAG: hypothetical protein H6621_08590 [Halobacteriovoraceae bacterium]|nr:hypothetical protein [Halobacteriovoraceae bacterium]MCB9095110.1 hypothetical protein [Halobacteriovoraceae bacterium]
MKRNVKIVLMSLLLLNLSSCFFGGKDISSALRGKAPIGTDDAIGSDPELLLSNVGVKNFEQINLTMAAITQVDFFQNTDLQATYDGIKTSLPAGNEMSQYTDAVQKAIVKLGTEYCNVMIDTSLAQVFPNISLDGTLSASEKSHLVDTIAANFWDGTGDKATIEEQKGELAKIIDFASSNSDERGTVLLGCTAGLTSPNVYFN